MDRSPSQAHFHISHFSRLFVKDLQAHYLRNSPYSASSWLSFKPASDLTIFQLFFPCFPLVYGSLKSTTTHTVSLEKQSLAFSYFFNQHPLCQSLQEVSTKMSELPLISFFSLS
jgi:hypothetical protein